MAADLKVPRKEEYNPIDRIREELKVLEQRHHQDIQTLKEHKDEVVAERNTLEQEVALLKAQVAGTDQARQKLRNQENEAWKQVEEQRMATKKERDRANMFRDTNISLKKQLARQARPNATTTTHLQVAQTVKMLTKTVEEQEDRLRRFTLEVETLRKDLQQSVAGIATERAQVSAAIHELNDSLALAEMNHARQSLELDHSMRECSSGKADLSRAVLKHASADEEHRIEVERLQTQLVSKNDILRQRDHVIENSMKKQHGLDNELMESKRRWNEEKQQLETRLDGELKRLQEKERRLECEIQQSEEYSRRIETSLSHLHSSQAATTAANKEVQKLKGQCAVQTFRIKHLEHEVRRKSRKRYIGTQQLEGTNLVNIRPLIYQIHDLDEEDAVELYINGMLSQRGFRKPRPIADCSGDVMDILEEGSAPECETLRDVPWSLSEHGAHADTAQHYCTTYASSVGPAESEQEDLSAQARVESPIAVSGAAQEMRSAQLPLDAPASPMEILSPPPSTNVAPKASESNQNYTTAGPDDLDCHNVNVRIAPKANQGGQSLPVSPPVSEKATTPLQATGSRQISGERQPARPQPIRASTTNGNAPRHWAPPVRATRSPPRAPRWERAREREDSRKRKWTEDREHGHRQDSVSRDSRRPKLADQRRSSVMSWSRDDDDSAQSYARDSYRPRY